MRIRTVYPCLVHGQGVPYTCVSLSRQLGDNGLAVHAHVDAVFNRDREPFIRHSCPFKIAEWLYTRPRGREWLRQRTLARARADLQPGDVAYLWPNVTYRTARRFKREGIRCVLEKVNCQDHAMVRILRKVYDHLRWPNPWMSEVGADYETPLLDACDFIWSPSPLVTESLLDAAVPRSKVLEASYGWDPARLGAAATRPIEPRADQPLKVLFVGLLCVRKGAPMLLNAWQRAGIDGDLLIAGNIDPEVAGRCAPLLNHPRIKLLGNVPDIARVYAQSDMFVLPSHEEGSPLVIYEAMAAGMACIVSPMGGGGVARDGLDAIVLDPYAEDQWVEALRALAADPERRNHLGLAARAHIQNYTWQRVGRRRAEQLKLALGVATMPAHTTDPADAPQPSPLL